MQALGVGKTGQDIIDSNSKFPHFKRKGFWPAGNSSPNGIWNTQSFNGLFDRGGDDINNPPVYFAVSHGREDWHGIYESHDGSGIDYPNTYENVSDSDTPDYNHNTETYRNKYVCHPNKGGAFEFVGTDNREILKMTHYSGSFKEFNNHVTTELATNDDQKLVMADQWLRVKGYRTEVTDADYDMIIRGDSYKKIGTFNIHNFNF